MAVSLRQEEEINTTNSESIEISSSSNERSEVHPSNMESEDHHPIQKGRNSVDDDDDDDDDDDEEQTSSKVVKDPRIRARKYQLDLCKKAVEENVIVFLGTGCGKTHIAVLVIYELGHLIRKPEKNVCVFLAPTVPLVRQQAAVIEESTDFKVGCYYGNSKRLKSHQEWEEEIDKYEVLVMTPQILLCNLFHRFIKMELIALLIFDECHHAQSQSNHPYAQIMKEYKRKATKRPRIFGMTASPIVGKGEADHQRLPKSINSLENLLDSKVYSVEDKEELENFVASPNVKYYDYASTADCTFVRTYRKKLEEIKNECITSARRMSDDLTIVRNNRKQLQRLHDNVIFCLDNLGLFGTRQAVSIFINGDQSEWTELMGTEGCSIDSCLANQYLTQAASIFESDLTKDGIGSDTSSSLEALEEVFFSKKLLVLIGILSSCRLRPDMKCIVFVNRVIIARTLAYVLSHLKCLEFWKCHFLVGFHSGLKNMSRKAMATIVEKFRSGELNLLVATKVGEEGLDIQTCCLVIRYDLPETVSSFIQSRGRARMPQSEYVFLVERGNQNEINLVEGFRSDEDRMIQEITCRTSGDTFDDLEEEYYEVHSTGATISAGYSVSLLYQYCAKLPRDEYFSPKPDFYFFDDTGGAVCRIILPSNAPIHEVRSLPMPSKDKSKKTACLKACKQLHEHGALTDYLCPGQDDAMEEGLTDSDICEDENSRGELHEMLTPAALKNPWINSEGSVILHLYFIRFMPIPEDRKYQQFGLFLKSPLPREAQSMKLDLHLAHGRIVKTELFHSGEVEFDKDEIIEAQKTQELFLKIILDRSDFFADFVPLGKHVQSLSSSSTFYLLLPVACNEKENKYTVDWKIIRSCLSSPVFRTPENFVECDLVSSSNSLILADGPARTSDIVNSLIFTPHNKLFFFVDKILLQSDANNPLPIESHLSYAEQYSRKSKIDLLYPNQPLLKAKQLFSLRNLLHNRVQGNTEARELEEHFVEIPPELCSLKIIGFSKEIGSSLSLLPSIMHRLENLLVAIELKSVLSDSFIEGSDVTALRLLEAITTEKCLERLSLERLEVLGDAFLKYAVGRHLFLSYEALDEGRLTRKRSSIVKNSNLYNLATRSNLQVYIRDEQFDPCQFYALGRPCKVICNEDTAVLIHSQQKSGNIGNAGDSSIKCSKHHHWLHKKTIADVVESLVGAFIVDSGFKGAIAFLKWVGIQVDFEGSQFSQICTASESYMTLSDKIDIGGLENSLGYRFLQKGLLVQAFVHPSYNRHSGGCYQRLEFLGDAVLDYLITSYLYSAYPKLKPGQLTDLRSASVNNVSFAQVAIGRCLQKYLISDSDNLSAAVRKFVNFLEMHPSKKGQDDGPTCPKALGDIVESSIGAILLDSGFNLDCVWEIMLSFLKPIMSFTNLHLNPGRLLQELCQSHNWEPKFTDTKIGGGYVVNAQVIGESVRSTSTAYHISKRIATRKAAEKIISDLKEQGYKAKKNKTLEHILKTTQKCEAKLIGFNETPIVSDVLDFIQLENLAIQETSSSDNNHTPVTKIMGNESTRMNSSTVEDISSVTGSQGFSCIGSAKSCLFDLCAGNCWQAPSFECVNEEGSSHSKLFTIKVALQIEENRAKYLECFSEPRLRKKAAMEHASEGALWYLRHHGFAQKVTSAVNTSDQDN